MRGVQVLFYRATAIINKRRLQRGRAPSHTEGLPSSPRWTARGITLCPSLCTKQGQPRRVRGEGQVPEGAAEEAGDEEPR